MSRPKEVGHRCITLDSSFGDNESFNDSTEKGYYHNLPFCLSLPNLDDLLLVQCCSSTNEDRHCIDISQYYENLSG